MAANIAELPSGIGVQIAYGDKDDFWHGYPASSVIRRHVPGTNNAQAQILATSHTAHTCTLLYVVCRPLYLPISFYLTAVGPTLTQLALCKRVHNVAIPA